MILDIKKFIFKYSYIDWLIILYLLFIIIPISPINIFEEINLSFSLNFRTINFLIQIIILSIFFLEFITKRVNFNINWFKKSIIVLFAYSFFISLIKQDFNLEKILEYSNSDYYYLKYFLNISTFFVLINQFINKDKLIQYCKNLIINSLVIISFLFILSQFFGYPVLGVSDAAGVFTEKGFIDNLYSRFTIYGWNANELSLFFNFATAFVISKLVKNNFENKFYNIYNLTILIFLINGTILTGSRMGLITLILSFLISIIFIIFKGSFIKQNIGKLIFLISFTSARIGFFPNVFLKRFAFFYETGEVNKNLIQLGGKLNKWQDSLNYGSNAVITGTGVIDFVSKTNSGLPENLFLELLVTSGIGGLILFLIVLFLFIKENIVYIKQSNDLENLLLTFCLFGGIISLNIFTIKSFWFVLAICYAKTQLQYKQIEKF